MKIATLTRPAPAGRKAPMTLPELMEQAQRLQATGQAEAAGRLAPELAAAATQHAPDSPWRWPPPTGVAATGR